MKFFGQSKTKSLVGLKIRCKWFAVERFLLGQRIGLRRGETILEVLIAMGVLSLVMMSAFGLIAQSIATQTNVKNRVTAIDLAREAIELVRNTRDTNWVKYSGDKRTQWLCYQDPCTAAIHRIDDGFYLADSAETEVLKKATEQSIIDLDVVADYAEYQMLSSDTLGFNHSSGDTTMFYRQVELTPYSDFACGTDKCPEVGLDVVVRIQWLESGRKSQLTLRSRLYDFYDRDSY